MDLFKFNAFVKEFPFLAEIARGDSLDCDSIKVKRITKELLNSTPEYHSAVGSLVGIDDEQVVAFVLGDGTVIENAVKRTGRHHSNYAHDDGFYRRGETVLEAIHRENLADKLAYVVVVESGYAIVNHHSEADWRMTIYKPAKDVSAQDLIEQSKKSALDQVKAESEF